MLTCPVMGRFLAFDLIVGATIWTELIVRMCKIARPISLKGPSRRPVAESDAKRRAESPRQNRSRERGRHHMPFDKSHGAAARLDRNRAIEVRYA
jgi:hypothetical protein